MLPCIIVWPKTLNTGSLVWHTGVQPFQHRATSPVWLFLKEVLGISLCPNFVVDVLCLSIEFSVMLCCNLTTRKLFTTSVRIMSADFQFVPRTGHWCNQQVLFKLHGRETETTGSSSFTVIGSGSGSIRCRNLFRLSSQRERQDFVCFVLN